MKIFAPTNNGLGHLGLFIPLRFFFFYFKFCMLLTRFSHPKALCYGVSRYINPFVNYVEQIKTIWWWQDFWKWNDIKDNLVSVRTNGNIYWLGFMCVWSWWKALTINWPQLALVCYFPLKLVFSITHVDVLESRSVLTSIVTSLLCLTMIGTKKHGVGSKNKLRPFSLHDASRSNLAIFIETWHVHFSILLVMGW
jgi:hypothetical protein